jgi:DNA-binding transcriptional LysR family regulator
MCYINKWKEMIQMEIRQLQLFIALAEEGSFTKAARQMNIVQSGLSISIKALEQELGTVLFDRTTRKVMLTPAGTLFLQHARASLVMLDNGVQAVRSQDGIVRGRLRLGILQSLGPYVDLPALLHTFRTSYPEVEFSGRSLNTETIPAQVRSGYVDLSFHALVSDSKDAGLRMIPFAQDSLIAICSTNHPFAVRRSVSLELLAREKFVDLTPERALRRLVDSIFQKTKLIRDSIYELSDVSMMVQFVANDLGVAIVPSELAHTSSRSSRLHFLPITGSGARLPKWRVVVVSRASRRDTPGKTIADRFLEVLSAYPTHTTSAKEGQQLNA